MEVGGSEGEGEGCRGKETPERVYFYSLLHLFVYFSFASLWPVSIAFSSSSLSCLVHLINFSYISVFIFVSLGCVAKRLKVNLKCVNPRSLKYVIVKMFKYISVIKINKKKSVFFVYIYFLFTLSPRFCFIFAFIILFFLF